MSITLLCIGQSMPSWVNQAYQEYAKRLHSPWDLRLIEIPAQKRGKNTPVPRILIEECKQLWHNKPDNGFNITLDRQGKSYNSQQLASTLEQPLSIGQNINLFVGGPEGVTSELLQKADAVMSLSALTFPHPLVRVILSEQIYRAWSIVHRHPYHR